MPTCPALRGHNGATGAIRWRPSSPLRHAAAEVGVPQTEAPGPCVHPKGPFAPVRSAMPAPATPKRPPLRRRAALALVLWLAAAALLSGRDARTEAQNQRDSRYFRLDAQQRVLGPASHLPGAMALQLVSATMDQPQYWPDEIVRLRLIAPGWASQKLLIQWSKRDATPIKAEAELDDAGLAVVELASGKQARLALGEYRVEVKSADAKLSAATTFAVVEGTLGEVSLAYGFERVTSTDALDKVKAGWFMGNASGAGQRWGNGLSFKNQLRVDNEPYNGEVQLVPRCMLSGCNGVVAGPQQRLQVSNGELAATLQVGGHSGPFQVEIVTPQGSLRHQFDGSGHVEREMIPVAKGVRWEHRVGLAPYQGTTQLPGRALWTARGAQPVQGDAFELSSLEARGGEAKVGALRQLKQVQALVWTAKPEGGFAATRATVPEKLAAGQGFSLKVAGPMALVSFGGVAETGPDKGQWFEGYAMVFGPVGVEGRIDVAERARPNDSVAVTVQLRDGQGQPLQGSAILEAYDIRVAAKDPAGPLASAVGDSLRRAGRHLDGWVDPVELERQRREEERLRKEEERRQRLEEQRERAREKREEAKLRREAKKDGVSYGYASGSGGIALKGSGMGGGGVGYGRASVSMKSASAGSAHGGHDHASGDDEAGEKVREGELKVSYVAVVRTDASGKVTLQVPTPPQVGRLAFRLTAVRGLGWHSAESQTDLQREASVEAQVPKALLSGGELQLRVVTHNQGDRPLTLRVSGAGFGRAEERPVGSGKHSHLLAWPAQAGELQLALVDAGGKTVDKRLFRIQDLGKQPVTWSRLELGGATPVAVQAGDRLVVYAGPGLLLGGIVSQVVTTMESWFPHAEALSAKIAVQATVLAAIRQGLLRDDGYTQGLRGGLEHSVQRLAALYDPSTALIRPYPGLAGNPRWSAWVAANLHLARRAWKLAPAARQQVAAVADQVDRLAKDLDGGLAKQAPPHGIAYDAQASYAAAQDGQEVIAVEIDGAVRHLAVTDDIVQRFAVDQLAPALQGVDCEDAQALGAALDKFRFLRAFSRVGRLQWLTGQAKAALAAGEKGRPAFEALFAAVARGMILAQEPGMLQGPAMLGGVYSQPMALPRFLELLLMMGKRPADAGAVTLQIDGKIQAIKLEQAVVAAGAGLLSVPRGAVVRLDRAGVVDLRALPEKPFAKALLSHSELAVGQEGQLELQLDPALDPLEYYALIAVPATVGIKQTQDALSDYKGQLIYGQQAMGSGKMQVIAVPFRGSPSIKLWIEGLMPGQAIGNAVIRHVHDPDRACSVKIAAIKVAGPAAEPQLRKLGQR